MTPRERFLKVFRGEMPDRMPVTLHMFDHARFVTKVYPEVDPLDYSAINLKSIELAKELGADVFARMLYDANDPITIKMGGLDVDQQTENWEVQTEEIQEGSTLIKRAYLMDAESIWTMIAAIVGIGVGLIKGRVLFSRSCKKNIERIKTLTDPSVWQFFRPGMLIFLAIMISAGAWMSRAAAGNYTFLCLVGALDLSISFALLTSSIVFWKK